MKILKKAGTHVSNCKFAKDSSIPATLFKSKVQKCEGKSLETVIYVNFSSNSTKTIRLFALDFYEAIVDSAFGLINYHLIEISSS